MAGSHGYVIGASLSEPHIDEFAVNFLYVYIYISVVRRAVSHACTALILCVPLASCVISKTTRAACGVQ